MPDQQRLYSALTEFAHTIVRDYDTGHMLDLLSDHVVGSLGIDGAGVSLADEEGRLQFVTATDEVVARVEQLQAAVGQGPCHEAFHAKSPVVINDLGAITRWSKFTPGALEAGMTSAVGIPMAVGEHCIGALNLYHRSLRTWSEDEVVVARLLADMATGYIIHAARLEKSKRLAEQLQHALDSRIVIEQAKGMIAARQQIDLNDAFGLLRIHARSHNLRLHDAAQEVVEGLLNL